MTCSSSGQIQHRTNEAAREDTAGRFAIVILHRLKPDLILVLSAISSRDTAHFTLALEIFAEGSIRADQSPMIFFSCGYPNHFGSCYVVKIQGIVGQAAACSVDNLCGSAVG
jgi:hypothetical protein